MTNEEFDKIMSEPYSKEGWAVFPLTKPPIDKHINEFLSKLQQSMLESLGIPRCIDCLVEIELDDEGNLFCPECNLIIKVSGDKNG